MSFTAADLDKISRILNGNRQMCPADLAIVMTDDRSTSWWLDVITYLITAGTITIDTTALHPTFKSMEPCITCAWPPFGRAESHVEFMTRHGFKGRHYYSPHIPE